MKSSKQSSYLHSP